MEVVTSKWGKHLVQVWHQMKSIVIFILLLPNYGLLSNKNLSYSIVGFFSLYWHLSIWDPYYYPITDKEIRVQKIQELPEIS